MMQLTHQQMLVLLGAFALGDVDQHVDRADHASGLVVQRRRIGNERHARAVGTLGDGFHAAHRAVFLQRHCHRALVMRHRRAVGPEQLPRTAPFAGAEFGTIAPQFGGRIVEIGEPSLGVGRIDGGGQSIEQLAEPAFTLDQDRLRVQQRRTAARLYRRRSRRAPTWRAQARSQGSQPIYPFRPRIDAKPTIFRGLSHPTGPNP